MGEFERMTNNISSIFLENVSNLEDLDIAEFIDKIEHLSDYILSEKLDGANLYVGFDLDGKIFCSRGEDLSENYSTVKDFPDGPEFGGFISAYKAILEKQDVFARYIKAGQAVELEIFFMRKPYEVNHTMDNRSYISIIRPIKGLDSSSYVSDANVDKLESALLQEEITVTSTFITSYDGESLSTEHMPITWAFEKSHSTKDFSYDINSELKALKKFLTTKNKEIQKLQMDLDYTNGEVLKINLVKIPVDLRPQVKEIRTKIQDEILEKFKLPIKNKLLTDLSKKVSGDKNATGGVIVRDPETNTAFKIGDKETSMAIQDFTSKIERNISSGIRTDDPNADIEERGGILGNAKIRIASLLGIKELAKTSTASNFLKKYKGKNELDDAMNVAKELEHLNFKSIKTKILAILNHTKDEINATLKSFKKNADSLKLTLKDGTEVVYSAETKRRTLTYFAEVKTQLSDMINNIEEADNFARILIVVFDHQFRLTYKTTMKEEILLEYHAPDLMSLMNMSHDDICWAYQSTLFASLLLQRAKDGQRAKLLRDTGNSSLKKYQKNMSQLNFWGLVLFNPDNKEIASHLDPQVKKQLWKTGHRFLTSRIKNIHQKLSNPNTMIDWDDQSENMRVVSLRLENRTRDVNIIRIGLVTWPDLALSEKEIVVSKIFYMLTRHCPTSPIIGRVREIANKLLLNADEYKKEKTNMGPITQIYKLAEDGEAVADAGAASNGAASNGSFPLMGGITTVSMGTDKTAPDKRLFKNKVVIKRKRGYVVPKPFTKPVKGEGNNE